MLHKRRLEVYRMAIHVFHSATIGSCQFNALITPVGLYICCRDPYRNLTNGLALGVSYLRYFMPLGRHNHGRESWWITKYGKDAVIDLLRLSQDQTLELANEFGIAFWVPPYGEDENYCRAAFYQGKAWDGLKSWVQEHPRVAEKFSKVSPYYLPHWYDTALNLRPVCTVPANNWRSKYLASLSQNGDTIFIP